MTETSVAFAKYTHTYHLSKAAYILPNSSPEQKRLQSQALALKALVGGNVIHTETLHDSPDLRILEIGPGTGAVTYDMARQFPSAKVYAVDLSKIQILQDKPPNVEFIIGDIFDLAGKDERLQPESFDFVFSRLLICGMTDWVGYLETVAYLLKPGALCEFQEYTWEHFIDGKRVDTEWKWMQAARDGARKQGLDLDVGKHMGKYVADAGIVVTGQKEYAVPTGRWTASSNPQSLPMGIDNEEYEIGFHLVAQKRMVDQTRFSDEELKELAEDCEHTLRTQRDGRYWPLIVTMARKPE